MLILHRIIDVKKNHYITYGDNCKNYEIVPFDTVLAVATGFYIKGKFVSCNDPEYLKYVEERCSSIKKRKLYPLKRKLAPETKVLLFGVTHSKEIAGLVRSILYQNVRIDLPSLLRYASSVTSTP